MDKQEKEQFLESRFNQLMAKVKEKTLNPPKEPEKPKEPELSEKGKKLYDILKNNSFGCSRNQVKQIVEILIDEKLPEIVMKKNKSQKKDDFEKYDNTICLMEDDLISFISSISNTLRRFSYTFSNKNTIPRLIKRLATETEIDNFFDTMLNNIDPIGFYDFFRMLDDFDSGHNFTQILIDDEDPEDFFDL